MPHKFIRWNPRILCLLSAFLLFIFDRNSSSLDPEVLGIMDLPLRLHPLKCVVATEYNFGIERLCGSQRGAAKVMKSAASKTRIDILEA